MTPPAPLDVVVVGAGIVGVSAALWLQRDGHRVTIVDRAGPGQGTSFGNGGVLAASSVVPVTGPGLPLALPALLAGRDSPLFVDWRYLPRAAPFLARYLRNCGAARTREIVAALTPIIGDSLVQHQALADGTPAGRWLRPADYIHVYPDRRSFEAERFAWELRRAAGFAWTGIDAPALRAREPLLDPRFGFAVALPEHGVIRDPGRYVVDLAAHAESQGAVLRRADVGSVIVEAGRAGGVMAGGEAIRADAVVLATGVWSKALVAPLGLHVPMESERGYHLELHAPSAMPADPLMIAAGKFVVTPMDGRIRVAGLLEFAGLDAPPNPRAFAQLERLVRAALPGLAWRDTSRWMGHRPAPADSIPVIGEVPAARGAWLAFGHHHVGLTGGPRTGRMVADLIAGRRSNIDLAPYRPDRFDTRNQ